MPVWSHSTQVVYDADIIHRHLRVSFWDDIKSIAGATLKGSQHRLYPLYLTAISTGLRRGEVLGLRWQDIDWDPKTIMVRQTVIVVNGKIEVSTAKTTKGNRTVAISAHLVSVLEDHKVQQEKDKKLLASGYHDYDLVFPYPDGRPIMVFEVFIHNMECKAKIKRTLEV